jgi:uncharacterized membrane protein HdeD (DUF308 family)
MVNKGISKYGILLIIIGILWILSDLSIVSLRDWEWVLKFWPILLIVAGAVLIYYGRKAKEISVLLLILAFFAATLHQGIKMYDHNWHKYDSNNEWDIFL